MKMYPGDNPCEVCGSGAARRFCSQRCTVIHGNRVRFDLTDEEIFGVNNVKRAVVKRRFMQLVPHTCDECGLGQQWNGKSLTLQLEHVNGIHNDNTFTNLRLLCPNCHSQTSTYVGRNRRKHTGVG